METYQYLSGLTNGNYTLTAWVRSGGGQNSAYLALKNCGSAEQRTDLPVSASGWIRIVTSIAVTNNQCTISINSDANAGNWINVDDLTFASGSTGLAIKGADVSSLAKSEAFGGVYKTSSGTTGDALAILKSAGHELRPPQGLGEPGRRLQQQGARPRHRQARQGAGHEAARRLPLLGHLGRPGRPDQAGRLGRTLRTAS